MNRNLLAILLLVCISLTGCAGMGGLMNGPLGSPPTPLASTQIDDQAVKTSFKAFDLALDAVNALIDAGIIKPGSNSANKIADQIENVKSALNAAADAQRAGQSSSYAEAMGRVRDSFLEIRLLIARAT